MNRIAFAVASLSLALVACRGGDDGPSGDDAPMIDAPAVAMEVTIQEVQNDAMPSGTPIELRGVVVTAIDKFGNRTGDFFVAEPGGGPNSGVKVFGAGLDQVAALTVGDLVDITGAIKHEACTAASPCGTIVFANGASLTEVMGVAAGTLVVTKTGTGTVPAPADVDASAISLLATRELRDAEWEKWEGVLIKVSKARQITAISPFGGDDSGPDENEFRATGFFRVQSALVELPTTSVLGTCYESVTGLGDFFFNYSVAPRTAADLVSGGTACRPMATTVAMVQTGVNVEIVDLNDVYVTARDDMGANKGIWVSDGLTGAANNGVYVFVGGSTAMPITLDVNLAIGARIDVKGTVDEFDLNGPNMTPPMGDTVTEIVGPPMISNIQAAGAAPTAASTATVATLANIAAAGEPWEGVLVRVGPVKVTNTNAGQGKVELTDNNGDKIIADDESFAINPMTGSTIMLNNCYATFTGVMHVQLNDNVRTINPRSLGDMVIGAGCN